MNFLRRRLPPLLRGREGPRVEPKKGERKESLGGPGSTGTGPSPVTTVYGPSADTHRPFRNGETSDRPLTPAPGPTGPRRPRRRRGSTSVRPRRRKPVRRGGASRTGRGAVLCVVRTPQGRRYPFVPRLFTE